MVPLGRLELAPDPTDRRTVRHLRGLSEGHRAVAMYQSGLRTRPLPAGTPSPFSCKGFYLCPSCSQKRTLLFAEHLKGRVLSHTTYSQYFKQNVHIFDALDFLADRTQHIPPKKIQLIRRYGLYASRTKGRWADMPWILERVRGLRVASAHYPLDRRSHYPHCCFSCSKQRPVGRPTASTCPDTPALPDSFSYHLTTSPARTTPALCSGGWQPGRRVWTGRISVPRNHPFRSRSTSATGSAFSPGAGESTS